MKRNRSVFFQLLFASLMMVLVPVGMILLAQLSTFSAMNSMAAQVAGPMVENELSFFDEMSRSMDRTYNAFYENEAVNRFLAMHPEEAMNPSAVRGLREELRRIAGSVQSPLYSVYVVFNNLNLAVTPDTACDTASFHKLNYDGADVPFETWNTHVSEYHDGDFVRLENGDILFMKSLYVDVAQTNAATVVISLPKDVLEGVYLNREMYDGSAVLVLADTDNNFLYSNDAPLLEHVDLLDVEAQTNIYQSNKLSTVRLEDGRYYTAAARVAKFKIYYFLKEAYVTQSTQLARNINIASIILALLSGGVITWFFTKKQMKPVQAILSLFPGVRENDKKRSNEYSVIYEQVHSIVGERKKLLDEMDSYQKRLQDERFKRVLVDQQFSQDGILAVLNDKNASYFTLLKVEAADTGTLKETNDLGIELAYAAFTNIFEEILGTSCELHMTHEANSLVILAASQKQHEKVLKTSLEVSLQKMEQYFGARFYAAVSAPCEGIANIAAALEEAQELLECGKDAQRFGIMTYRDIADVKDIKEFYNDYTKKLTVQILECNIDSVRQTIRDFYEMVQARQFRLSDVKAFTSRSIDIVFNDLLLSDASRNEWTDYYTEYDVSPCRSVSEVSNLVEDIFVSFVTMLRRAKEDNQLAVDVAEYVKEHFHDPNLSVRMIAEEFSITPSYLTQKFKAVFRMGLLDYINYYRIEQTKKLILNSHVPFSDIAQRCGFASTATFTRLFKKYVGTVPSEFRKMGGGQG